jgi:ER lumen protein retaining receptor
MKHWQTAKCSHTAHSGVSLRTLDLLLAVLGFRVVGDLHTTFFFDIVNLVAVVFAIVLVRYHEPTRFTYDPRLDACPHFRWLVAPCGALTMLICLRSSFEVASTVFSFFLEAVAMVPQLVLLTRCRPEDSNGVQSFVHLMFIYHLLRMPFVHPVVLFGVSAVIPYLWFFQSSFRGCSDDRAVRYQRRRWFATIRSELLSVGMAARSGFRDFSGEILQTEFVQTSIMPLRADLEIICRNIKTDLSTAFSEETVDPSHLAGSGDEASEFAELEASRPDGGVVDRSSATLAAEACSCDRDLADGDPEYGELSTTDDSVRPLLHKI